MFTYFKNGIFENYKSIFFCLYVILKGIFPRLLARRHSVH